MSRLRRKLNLLIRRQKMSARSRREKLRSRLIHRSRKRRPSMRTTRPLSRWSIELH